MAPLVRTGGSRHTGLAALPHRNIQKQHNTVIQICDTGIGISEENRQRIFEPFFRVDKSRSREMGGAGLGLSIVKKIIEKHDGTITVSNNNPQGACFIIELPLYE